MRHLLSEDPLIATLQYSVSVFSARFFVFHSVYLIRSHDPYPSDERGREVRRNKNEATRMHFLLCKGEKAIREPFRCSEVHPHSCTPRNVCYSDIPSWWHIPSPTSDPRSIHTEQPASTTVWSHDEGLVASPILHWVYDPIQTAIETRVTQELLALSSTEYTGGEGSTERLTGRRPLCAAILQTALPMNPFPIRYRSPMRLPPTTTRSGTCLK